VLAIISTRSRKAETRFIHSAFIRVKTIQHDIRRCYMQGRMMMPGIEWLRRARFVAVAAFVTLGLVLVLGSTPAHAAQLTVTWSDATPDDHTGFKVERKTGTTGAFAQAATTGPTVMVYLDTTLTAGTTYCYRVRAYNTAGDSPYTAEACAVAPTPVLRTR